MMADSQATGERSLPSCPTPIPSPPPAENGPDVTPHLAIYRSSDGYATFHRYVPDPHDRARTRLENLFSVPVRDLSEWFPSLAGWLVKDAYASVNTFYGPKPFPSQAVPQLGFPDRRERSLRHLCACYCDVDVGRLYATDPTRRLTAGQAIGVVYDLVRAKVLPPVTIYAESGRGVYVFWLLHGASEDEPHRLYRANHKTDLALYKSVNKALQGRIRGAGAYVDAGAHDAARILRTHGSFHTGAAKHTRYLIAGDDQGGHAYRLYDLAQWLGLSPHCPDMITNDVRKAIESETGPSPEALPVSGRPAPEPAVAGHAAGKDAVFVNSGKRGAKKGNRRKAEKRLTDVLAIEQHHGGFCHGRRRKSLVRVARFMVDMGSNDRDLHHTLAKLAGRCHPPYPSEANDPAISHLVQDARHGRDGLSRMLRNDILAGFFGVTAEMARELDLESIVPAEVRREREARPPPQKAHRLARQGAILRRLETHPADAGQTCKWWSQYLVRECGAPASTSPATVCRDFRSLEKNGLITRGEGGRGRPRKAVSH